MAVHNSETLITLILYSEGHFYVLVIREQKTNQGSVTEEDHLSELKWKLFEMEIIQCIPGDFI